MSFVLAFIGFALLVILHELGHFVAAKAVGMRVERFSLFFPPLIARYRPKGSETEYAIGAIPLGGYVKISGMSPDEELPPEVAHRAYYKQKVWKRIVTILAGPLVNIVLAFVILWVLFISEGRSTDRLDLRVAVTESDGASADRLRKHDLLLAVDGVRGFAPGLTETQRRSRADAIRAQINRHRCAPPRTDGCRATTPARFTVRRDGRRQVVQVTPRYEQDVKRMLAGFAFAAQREDVGVAAGAGYAVTGMWEVSRLTVERIAALTYDSKARDEVSGVVGSYEATRQSFDFDTIQAIQVLALISLSLGIINLFPFLPLDGGHIFWAVAEKIRRRPISYATMEKASIVGIGLVLVLFFIGFTNDIDRISSGEGFGVR